MVKKLISKLDGISYDRMVEAVPTIDFDRITLKCRTYFVDANGTKINNKNLATVERVFDTFGQYVNPMSGEEVSLIYDPVLEGEEPTPGHYPVGSIPKITFLQNIPKDLFPDLTIFGLVVRLVSMQIDELDNEHKFD